LTLSKTSRKAGYYQHAYSAILHAQKLQAPMIHIEKARWLWENGQNRHAMSELSRYLNQDHSLEKERFVHAKVKFFITLLFF